MLITFKSNYFFSLENSNHNILVGRSARRAEGTASGSWTATTPRRAHADTARLVHPECAAALALRIDAWHQRRLRRLAPVFHSREHSDSTADVDDLV